MIPGSLHFVQSLTAGLRSVPAMPLARRCLLCTQVSLHSIPLGGRISHSHVPTGLCRILLWEHARMATLRVDTIPFLFVGLFHTPYGDGCGFAVRSKW